LSTRANSPSASPRSPEPSPASPNPLESLPYLLDQSIALWNARLAARLKLIGLTFEQWRILLVTIRRGPMNIRNLSNATLVPHSTVGRWLTTMEEDGLVKRRQLSSDNRSVEIHVTRKGRRVYESALPLAVAEYKSALRNFSSAEAAILINLVRQLRDNLATKHPADDGTQAHVVTPTSDSRARA
jgi:DNA-binding MarR family transcriptional regulator